MRRCMNMTLYQQEKEDLKAFVTYWTKGELYEQVDLERYFDFDSPLLRTAVNLIYLWLRDNNPTGNGIPVVLSNTDFALASKGKLSVLPTELIYDELTGCWCLSAPFYARNKAVEKRLALAWNELIGVIMFLTLYCNFPRGHEMAYFCPWILPLPLELCQLIMDSKRPRRCVNAPSPEKAFHSVTSSCYWDRNNLPALPHSYSFYTYQPKHVDGLMRLMRLHRHKYLKSGVETLRIFLGMSESRPPKEPSYELIQGELDLIK